MVQNNQGTFVCYNMLSNRHIDDKAACLEDENSIYVGTVVMAVALNVNIHKSEY
jgi:hypothetical protein